MKTRITTILSAAFLAAALATAATAGRTPLPQPSPLAAQNRAAATDGAARHDAATTGAAPRATTDGAAVTDTTSANSRGNIACRFSLGVDCAQQIETWLPE